MRFLGVIRSQRLLLSSFIGGKVAPVRRDVERDGSRSEIPDSRASKSFGLVPAPPGIASDGCKTHHGLGLHGLVCT